MQFAIEVESARISTEFYILSSQVFWSTNTVGPQRCLAFICSTSDLLSETSQNFSLFYILLYFSKRVECVELVITSKVLDVVALGYAETNFCWRKGSGVPFSKKTFLEINFLKLKISINLISEGRKKLFWKHIFNVMVSPTLVSKQSWRSFHIFLLLSYPLKEVMAFIPL